MATEKDEKANRKKRQIVYMLIVKEKKMKQSRLIDELENGKAEREAVEPDPRQKNKKTKRI